jgi:hypothetical protein
VLAEDLETYATAFRLPLARLTVMQERVYRALRRAGPLTARELKQETGLLNRQIMPALHRLQHAFLVYEGQEDSGPERPWSLLPASWPEINLERRSWREAAAQVVLRLVESLAFATAAQLHDGLRLSVRPLRRLLAELEADGRLRPGTVAGLGEGWCLPADQALPDRPLVRGVWMLHRADPLVACHASDLKARFPGREVLQYLLVDGQLEGAVCGHWRIGPHDVEDVVVTLPAAAAAARREEVLAAVAHQYQPPRSRIVRYAGVPL